MSELLAVVAAQRPGPETGIGALKDGIAILKQATGGAMPSIQAPDRSSKLLNSIVVPVHLPRYKYFRCSNGVVFQQWQSKYGHNSNMVMRSQIAEREWLRLLTDELLKAETASDAFRIFCTAMRSVGFKAAMFVCRSSGKDWKHQVTETTYPREWMDHYCRCGYHKTDPTRVYGLLMARPFFWKEMYPRLRKKDLMIFNEIREFGLVSGLAIPAFDAGRLVGGIGLAADTQSVEDDRLKPTLGLAFHFFSAIYDQLIKSEHKVAIDNDIDFQPLTKKELEVIGRVTFGLNNDEIAEAMNITRSAVEYHLKNIFAKLGAQNRVSAVVIAIKLGIVDPM